MFVKFQETIREYLGWCPYSPAVHTAHPGLIAPIGISFLVPPDGGGGGSGRIGRGISVAMESAKILNRNRSLLWFSLVTGLTAIIVFIAQYGVGLLSVYPYDAIDFPRWLVIVFATGLFSACSWNVLMAGLLLNLSPENGSSVSFSEGLSRLKSHLRPLAEWSVILAVLCTAIFAVLRHLGFSRFSLYPAASLFPFRFIFLPEVYHIGPIGGTFAMLYALAFSVVMGIIVLLLTIITLFVVPLLVLENRSLPDAVTGSFTLMKRVIPETLVVFLVIGAVLVAVSLLALLFGAVYGILAPDMQPFWYPGIEWIAAALLFILALSALAFIGSTIAVIALRNLYQYAKTLKVPVT